MQPWHLSYRADSRAVLLADRHYSRQKPGTPQFVPPGSCLVLRTDDYGALWTTSWPKAEYVKHAWAGAWVCSLFRNERRRYLSSDLIRAAVAATRAHYGEPPPLGMITFVHPGHVPGFFRRTPTGRVLEWGYSYQQAGFEYDGWTKGGLFALRMAPDTMPPPLAAAGHQLDLLPA